MFGLLYLLFWLIWLQIRLPFSAEEWRGQTVCLIGRVDKKVQGENGWSLSLHDIRPVQADGARKGREKLSNAGESEIDLTRCKGVLCYMAQDAFSKNISVPPLGSYVMVEGVCRPFSRATNDGQFDWQSYEQILNLDFSITNSKLVKQSGGYNRIREMLWQFKMKWQQSYERTCSKDEAAFFAAIILGDASDMDLQLKNLFRQNGLAHILAVSGLHVSLLGMGVYRLLRRANVPLMIQIAVSLMAVLIYGIILDAGIATLRAVMMFGIYLLAKPVGRTYDMATALTIAACILVTANPALLQYAGFLYSFTAVLAIVLFYPVLRECLGVQCRMEKATWFSGIYDAFLVSASVNLFLVPIQLYFYYEIQTYGVLLNLIILPLFSVMLYSAFLGGIVAMVHTGAGIVLLLPSKWLFAFYRNLLSVAGKLPGRQIICGRPQWWQMILYYIVLLGITVTMAYHNKGRKKHGAGGDDHKTNERGAEKDGEVCDNSSNRHIRMGKFRKEKIILYMVLQVAVCMLCIHIRRHTEITFLDVGQGDGCVIRHKSGCTFLIDAGSSDDPECGERRLLPFLKYHGISTVDYAFLSHPDDDHMNALIQCMELQEKSGVRITHLVVSPYARQGGKYKKVLDAAAAAGCEVLIFHPGDAIRVSRDAEEPFCIRCLFPYGTEKFEEANDQSLVLRVESGSLRVLFTGDMGEKEESALLQEMKSGSPLWEDGTEVDILKVAHHGSRYSTCEEFLNKTQPRIALISAGQDNRYGHPHVQLLERLEQNGCQIYQTPDAGAVTVRTEGQDIWLETFIK